MNYYDTALRRTSCRNYDRRPIPEDIHKKLMEIVTNSPSSGGFQNYSIIRVQKASTKKRLSKV